ncbi:MAG: hypothetical protein CL687_02195 [Candidatus Pelagibacter sp.]|nr:hypothetical protein [Candidatus Pelagibacter sp.]|tara:strand:- start:1350 stop:1643 length:294 start_codon:yes stop_codon:yes gene_type:complete
MIGNIILLMFFFIIWWYLVEYIKYYKTGDPEERDDNYWKFSYDFKPTKKEDFLPDSLDVLKRRRFRNRLVFLLYADLLVIFILLNSLASRILERIFN